MRRTTTAAFLTLTLLAPGCGSGEEQAETGGMGEMADTAGAMEEGMPTEMMPDTAGAMGDTMAPDTSSMGGGGL